ncbi:outer membrane lipoprotein-sorting protein [Desulfovibrio sp. UCD-KL4C]|uniref:outer membrane lipoprotein-sorting protein n=1 Tax=Desulfovibrio sp. UCD-KL4C TaxID=2578120 RepID=UPI0025C16C34|nr:outer membrane lipoprotein-sorting protein [Desulfovibrio sp. UCD-KL4C]
MKYIRLLAAAFMFAMLIGASPAKAEVSDVGAIVKRANHMALYQGETCKGKIHLQITDSQGRTRVRDLNILRKDADRDDGKQMYMSYFKAPADVRKMVFLVHKVTQPGKDDSRWLYMPSLDMVKRIAAGDKRTSFAGSDFLYEDISGRSLYEDVHELIGTKDGCYILKNTPKNPGDVEFSYYIAYVDKNSFIPMKTEYFKSSNTPYRTMEVVKVEKIIADKGGEMISYPTVTCSKVRNNETGSETVMTFSNITYNLSVEESVFGERYLRRPPRELMR